MLIERFRVRSARNALQGVSARLVLNRWEAQIRRARLAHDRGKVVRSGRLVDRVRYHERERRHHVEVAAAAESSPGLAGLKAALVLGYHLGLADYHRLRISRLERAVRASLVEREVRASELDAEVAEARAAVQVEAERHHRAARFPWRSAASSDAVAFRGRPAIPASPLIDDTVGRTARDATIALSAFSAGFRGGSAGTAALYRAAFAVRDAAARGDLVLRRTRLEAELGAVDEEIAGRGSGRDSAVPDPVPITSGTQRGRVLDGLAGLLLIGTAILFSAADFVLAVRFLSPVLQIPSHGRDAWHGWMLGLAIALLCIPLKWAFDTSVEQPRVEGDPRAHRRNHRVMLATAAVVLTVLALTAILRVMRLIELDRIANAAASDPITAAFVENPLLVGITLVGLTCCFPLIGGIAFSKGYRLLRAFLMSLGSSVRQGWAWLRRTIDASSRAGATSRLRRRRHQIAMQRMVAACELALLEENATIEAEWVAQLDAHFYAEGDLARETIGGATDDYGADSLRSVEIFLRMPTMMAITQLPEGDAAALDAAIRRVEELTFVSAPADRDDGAFPGTNGKVR